MEIGLVSVTMQVKRAKKVLQILAINVVAIVGRSMNCLIADLIGESIGEAVAVVLVIVTIIIVIGRGH